MNYELETSASVAAHAATVATAEAAACHVARTTLSALTTVRTLARNALSWYSLWHTILHALLSTLAAKGEEAEYNVEHSV